MPLQIRPALESDVNTIFELTYALALYERKTPDQILVTEEKLRKRGFGPAKVFDAVIAFENQVPCAMAVYFFMYAGSIGDPILYIEDLFVLPEYRGRGIGTSLLAELSRIASERECQRMEWHVFAWNTAAIRFYESIGSTVREDLKQVRLESSLFSALQHRAL